MPALNSNLKMSIDQQEYFVYLQTNQRQLENRLDENQQPKKLLKPVNGDALLHAPELMPMHNQKSSSRLEMIRSNNQQQPPTLTHVDRRTSLLTRENRLPFPVPYLRGALW